MNIEGFVRFVFLQVRLGGSRELVLQVWLSTGGTSPSTLVPESHCSNSGSSWSWCWSPIIISCAHCYICELAGREWSFHLILSGYCVRCVHSSTPPPPRECGNVIPNFLSVAEAFDYWLCNWVPRAGNDKRDLCMFKEIKNLCRFMLIMSGKKKKREEDMNYRLWIQSEKLVDGAN